MSKETTEWLNRNVLRGFVEQYGQMWHFSEAAQGDEANHYVGAIPVADLHRRLFGWKAEARTVYVDTADGPAIVPGRQAWVRDDTNEVLGIHGDGYKGHQYGEWLVRNVEILIDDTLSPSSAGLLAGGAIAWVQLQMPESITFGEGVTIRPFLTATTSFDGSIATNVRAGYVNVVCDNTHAAMMSERSSVYRVKHTTRSEFKVTDARAALGILSMQTDGFMAEIEALTSVEVSDGAWSKFLEAHAPIETGATGRGVTMAENRREELTRLWNTDVRVSPWRNSAWGVIQAVNTYTHHIGTVRNTSRPERNMLRMVKGEASVLDKATLVTLETVLGRTITPAALASV